MVQDSESNPPGWEGQLAPQELAELEAYLDRQVESYRKLGEHPAYMRVVSKHKGGGLEVVQRAPLKRTV